MSEKYFREINKNISIRQFYTDIWSCLCHIFQEVWNDLQDIYGHIYEIYFKEIYGNIFEIYNRRYMNMSLRWFQGYLGIGIKTYTMYMCICISVPLLTVVWTFYFSVKWWWFGKHITRSTIQSKTWKLKLKKYKIGTMFDLEGHLSLVLLRHWFKHSLLINIPGYYNIQ